jgi:Raf kinase inhibitor-like YbhB/YbcL family protein
MTAILNKTLSIQSPAFEYNTFIPARYSCDGENISPELQIGNIPEETVSLVLIMDDPDAPNGTYDHWLMWDIPVAEKIQENTAPGIQGNNSAMQPKYTGPCPPGGVHHYHFKIFALDSKLRLPKGSDKDTLLRAMEGHIRAHGKIVGLYKR